MLKLPRIARIASATCATVLALSAPAGATASTSSMAGSGGGCRGPQEAVDPCISQSGSFIYADFYMNHQPDYSRCLAILQIIKDGRVVKSQDYSLTRTGRYGPISTNRYSYPPSRGSAYSKVHVYTCGNSLHHIVTSPTLYYP